MWYYLLKINESYEVALYELIAIPSHSDSWNEKEIFMILLNFPPPPIESPVILDVIRNMYIYRNVSVYMAWIIMIEKLNFNSDYYSSADALSVMLLPWPSCNKTKNRYLKRKYVYKAPENGTKIWDRPNSTATWLLCQCHWVQRLCMYDWNWLSMEWSRSMYRA